MAQGPLPFLILAAGAFLLLTKRGDGGSGDGDGDGDGDDDRFVGAGFQSSTGSGFAGAGFQSSTGSGYLETATIAIEVLEQRTDPDSHPMAHIHLERLSRGSAWTLGQMVAGAKLDMLKDGPNGMSERDVYTKHWHYVVLNEAQLQELRTLGAVEVDTSYGFNVDTPKPEINYYHSHLVRLVATR